MIRKSYVPPPDLRELRDLLRTQRKLIRAAAAERNRTQNLLERCNLKLGRVASDVFGVSGLAMLRALAQGQTDPDVLAGLALGRMRSKRDALRLALDGRIQEHHRFLLQVHLDVLDHLDAQIHKIQTRIDERLAPYRELIERLMEIPGVKDTVAATIVAEIGTDMSVFESAEHLAAWAGLCPGNNRSADKRRREPVRKGNVHLQSILVEAALAARNHQGHLLQRQAPPPTSSTGEETRQRLHRTQAPHQRLPHPQNRTALQGARRALPRSPRRIPRQKQLGTPPSAPRLFR